MLARFRADLIDPYGETLQTFDPLTVIQAERWHSLRQKFGSDLRKTNLRDLCDLRGWRNIQTVLTCYVRPDEDAQRAVLTGRANAKRAISS